MGKKTVNMILSLEQKTRLIIEAEQTLKRLRAEQRALFSRLAHRSTDEIKVRQYRKRSKLSKSVLDTVRVVEAGSTTADEVSHALGVSSSCARMRLGRVVNLNLVARMGRGKYGPRPTNAIPSSTSLEVVNVEPENNNHH